MADEIDKASEQSQVILEKTISRIRDNLVDPYQNESGVCWECNAPVKDNRRWCSIECRDAAEKGER